MIKVWKPNRLRRDIALVSAHLCQSLPVEFGVGYLCPTLCLSLGVRLLCHRGMVVERIVSQQVLLHIWRAHLNQSGGP